MKRHAAEWQEKGTKTLEKRVVQAKEVAVVAKKKSVDFADLAKKRSSEVVSDRGVQVAAASALGGGVVVGAGGAATGLVAGGAIGAAMGILPALFTFGLSIPVGAVMGAGCGVAVGGTVGGVTGFTGAGAIGYSAYAKRAELRAAAFRAKTVALNTYYLVLAGKQKAVEQVVSAHAAAHRQMRRHAALLSERCIAVVGVAMEKSMKAKGKATAMASDKEVQATAASAAGGAVVLGAGGAATGLVAGGALGAVVGIVPALLTFGLSIPFCAVVGGGLGLVAGTSVGGTTGAVAGAGVYTKREAIKGYAAAVKKTAFTAAKSLKAKLQGTAA